MQGDYDFRFLGASWPDGVRFLPPCCDFTGSLKPLELGTAGILYFHLLKRGGIKKTEGNEI